MNTITYNLPDFWASALINNDWSGLDYMGGTEDLMQWLESHPEIGGCLAVNGQSVFTSRHDARGVLACNCLEYTFVVKD